MKTALEFFVEELEDHLAAYGHVFNLKQTEGYEIANTLEKQQIIDAFDKGSIDGMESGLSFYKGIEYEDKTGEQYYTETFKQ